MKRLPFLLLTLLACSTTSWSQNSKTINLGSVSVAVGKAQGTLSLDYFHNWNFGKKQRLQIGLGGRFTSYLGNPQYYQTAPAKLTSGSTGPGVFFKENIPANIDTFIVSSPQVNMLNAAINFSYSVTPRIQFGFNIDLIGVSFGKQTKGTYINGIFGSMPTGKPTTFNVLLISDNDLGSLNSEFYGRYFFNDKWGVKIAFQFLFTEYTTTTQVQKSPEPNDRFRNKSSLFSVGVTRKFN